MKPIIKKVIEAGLIPKHTLLLFKRWGYLEPEATDVDIPESVTSKELKAGFIRFVEELDELIEAKADEGIKETRFAITLKEPFRIKWLREDKYSNYIVSDDWIVVVFQDEAGRLIFPPSADPTDRKFIVMSNNERFEITTCTPLWYGDTLYAYQVEATRF